MCLIIHVFNYWFEANEALPFVFVIVGNYGWMLKAKML